MVQRLEEQWRLGASDNEKRLAASSFEALDVVRVCRAADSILRMRGT